MKQEKRIEKKNRKQRAAEKSKTASKSKIIAGRGYKKPVKVEDLNICQNCDHHKNRPSRCLLHGTYVERKGACLEGFTKERRA